MATLPERIRKNLHDLATGQVHGLVQRRRVEDWDLAADLGARTAGQRWLLYVLATVMFLAAVVNVTLAWAAGDAVGTTLAGIVAAGSTWLLTELGTTVGLGPKPDPPAVPRPRTLEDLDRGR